MAKNYYEILGVSKTATQAEIKDKYRKLARQYHPDLHPNDEECAKKFKEINEANETLSDPEKRKKYDYELEHPEAAGFGGFGGGSGFSGFGGFGDIFGDIFGFGGNRGGAQRNTKGEDIQIEIEISFLDAVKGVRKDVTYTRKEPCSACRGNGSKNGTAYSTCTSCNGTGQKQYTVNAGFFQTVRVGECNSCKGTGKIIKEKCDVCGGKGYSRKQTTVTLDIPAGANTGNYLKKNKYGQASTLGGEPGDLIVIIKVLPHKLFKRKDFDLYVDVPISYTTAVLGGKVLVPGVDKMEELEIPKGTLSGKVLTLRGKGINSRLGSGHLYCTIVVDIPTKLTSEQENLIKRYALEGELKNSPKMKSYSDEVSKLYGEDPYKKIKY